VKSYWDLWSGAAMGISAPGHSVPSPVPPCCRAVGVSLSWLSRQAPTAEAMPFFPKSRGVSRVEDCKTLVIIPYRTAGCRASEAMGLRKNNRAISHVLATQKGSLRNTFTIVEA